MNHQVSLLHVNQEEVYQFVVVALLSQHLCYLDEMGSNFVSTEVIFVECKDHHQMMKNELRDLEKLLLKN